MKDGSTIPAGFWAEEVVEPFRILSSAGIDVVFATPGGAPAILQAYSLDEAMTGSADRTAELQRRIHDLEGPLSEPLALAAVNAETIDASIYRVAPDPWRTSIRTRISAGS